jgi:hypothetical protein
MTSTAFGAVCMEVLFHLVSLVTVLCNIANGTCARSQGKGAFFVDLIAQPALPLLTSSGFARAPGRAMP